MLWHRDCARFTSGSPCQRSSRIDPKLPPDALVDTNNLVSLQAGMSIGTYDLARLEAPFTFRRGRSGEPYQAIGRGAFNVEGLPLLADAHGPFGNPSSDSERSMIGETAQKVMMVIFDFEAKGDLEVVLALASGHLRDYCAASDLESEIVQGQT